MCVYYWQIKPKKNDNTAERTESESLMWGIKFLCSIRRYLRKNSTAVVNDLHIFTVNIFNKKKKKEKKEMPISAQF